MPAVDADTLAVVQSAVVRTALGKIFLTRRNVRQIPFQFFRGGAVIELASGSSGQLVLKSQGDFPGGALARALTWTQEGNGVNTVYWFELDLRTAELEALFAVEVTVPVTPEPPSLPDLILELNYIEAGRPQTPIKMPTEVFNRYLQADENLLTPADPDYPASGNILTASGNLSGLTDVSVARTNLGLATMLCREAVALPAGLDADAPVDFGLTGADGQYSFDAARSRLWVYLVGQWRFTTWISG